MLGVLREELRGRAGGAEEGVIRAALLCLGGPAREQADVKALLLLFAFVPEVAHPRRRPAPPLHSACSHGATARLPAWT
jgi:hypothetical protein